MMDLNFNVVVGFLIWSAFCLGMLLTERISSRKWKRAAKAMELHAAYLQAMIDFNSDNNPLWDSIPTGVITHAKKQ